MAEMHDDIDIIKNILKTDPLHYQDVPYKIKKNIEIQNIIVPYWSHCIAFNAFDYINIPEELKEHPKINEKALKSFL